jgi:hypothetical protein
MSSRRSSMTVPNMLILLSCWFCQIYAKPISSSYSSSLLIFRLSYFLSAIHNIVLNAHSYKS